ncbi:hypothetical protein NL676_038463 [Syzygium grande]|nr:hypothetical protein NL676_038463 [Syzygium grande]
MQSTMATIRHSSGTEPPPPVEKWRHMVDVRPSRGVTPSFKKGAQIIEYRSLKDHPSNVGDRRSIHDCTS